MDQEKIDRLTLLDSFVNEFWAKKDRRLSRVLKVMDSVETWVFDDKEDFARSVNEMAGSLSTAGEEKIKESVESLITVMAYMSSSKSLRLLGWLEENYPEVFKKMLEALPGHPKAKAARLLSTRVRVMSNLNLMGKVFNPSRSQKITQWLRSGLSNEASE